MAKIPKQNASKGSRIPLPKEDSINKNNTILFSFESLDKNEFFNLDGTCKNWSSDLFDIMKIVSKISITDIRAGKYSNEGSTLRIHDHKNAKAPCELPNNTSLKDMWQIRISKTKGGIHGVFVENIFYVIWLDPLHNLYPDDRYGGLRKVVPPSTCCKERDTEILELHKKINEYEEKIKVLEGIIES